MTQLGTEDPRFGWAVNKGYATPEHRAALHSYGPTALHRRSWNLEGVAVDLTAAEGR
jgi:ribonuclease HII